MMDENRPRIKPRILEWLASHKWMISLQELQSAAGEELRPFREAGRTLLPSVLDWAFKGEL
jgi:hypothetical protein